MEGDPRRHRGVSPDLPLCDGHDRCRASAGVAGQPGMMPLTFESLFGMLKSVQANDENFIGLVKVCASPPKERPWGAWTMGSPQS